MAEIRRQERHRRRVSVRHEPYIASASETIAAMVRADIRRKWQ
jgi:hypothetical protein